MTEAIVAEHAPDEHLTSFLLPDLGVRGCILRAAAGVSAMLGNVGPLPDVRRLLGELCAAAPLMAAHLKLDGRLALQIQNAAQLSLLLVQVDQNLQLRGMARPHDGASGDFDALCRDGIFAVTLEPSNGQSYQALVPVDGNAAAQALQSYFDQSEQLPTRFVLGASDRAIAGLMLQRLPDLHDDGRGWEHARALAETASGEELLSQHPSSMLRRLFHAETLVLHQPRPLTVACNCSRARISRMLLSLGEAEVREVLAEQGQVEVRCDFCGAAHHYDAEAVRALFAGEADMSEPDASRETRH